MTRASILAFREAVAKAGSQVKLAKICGCTGGNIQQLLKKERELPAEFVLKVEYATGVSRSKLRPDIYPDGLAVNYAAPPAFKERPYDIDTFDAMCIAIRATAAAIRAMDRTDSHRDAAYFLEFALEAIEKGEAALDADTEAFRETLKKKERRNDQHA